MAELVKVVSAMIGTTDLRVYFANGEQQSLSNTDFKTADLMTSLMPALVQGKPIEIDLDKFRLKKPDIKTNVIVEKANGKVSLKSGDVTIPDAKKLESQIEDSKKFGGQSLANFVKKFGEIKRKHTESELLTFLGGVDLPLAEDGSIIGWKILGRTSGDHMVDHHSGRVRQKLGSLVFMKDSKVDDDRRHSCGVGLHIAARRYLRGFWYGTSKLCLVKIQPKDVIAVPTSEQSKMRVSAYHIVGIFHDKDASEIVNGADISTLPNAAALLNSVVLGDHTPIVEKVEISDNSSTITVTPVAQQKIAVAKAKNVERAKKAAKKRVQPAPKMDPKDARILNKLLRNQPRLADRKPAYLKKLVKAQRMLDEGQSLRSIAEKLSLDRSSLSANLIRKSS